MEYQHSYPGFLDCGTSLKADSILQTLECTSLKADTSSNYLSGGLFPFRGADSDLSGGLLPFRGAGIYEDPEYKH
ncbi:hypothetical protein EAI75_09045 [Bifidobacterium longum]|nr:hypothetical protein DVB78_02395 [Bifidobacterium longum subsp. longum]RGJ90484.1 hypothetical protein DXD41_00155 [Bifidobacterium longum]RGK01346.1 hypothetical protein DXD37_00335 [Bifidobacterium longum]RHN29476.1 hypothetical protein DWZ18_07900 [Bifidobacterium longum]RHN32868.1 hypothetical protein DWZ17_07640 [Bifidobacterium longum]